MVKVIALCLLLTACQTTSGNFCLLNQPTRLTPEEIVSTPPNALAAIYAVNEKGAKLCGWKPNG